MLLCQDRYIQRNSYQIQQNFRNFLQIFCSLFEKNNFVTNNSFSFLDINRGKNIKHPQPNDNVFRKLETMCLVINQHIIKNYDTALVFPSFYILSCIKGIILFRISIYIKSILLINFFSGFKTKVEFYQRIRD